MRIQTCSHMRFNGNEAGKMNRWTIKHKSGLYNAIFVQNRIWCSLNDLEHCQLKHKTQPLHTLVSVILYFGGFIQLSLGEVVEIGEANIVDYLLYNKATYYGLGRLDGNKQSVLVINVLAPGEMGRNKEVWQGQIDTARQLLSECLWNGKACGFLLEMC